jgi:phage replication O-like protein O
VGDEPKGQEPKANYFKVSNDWWDALSAYRVPGEAMQCLLVIIRKTYGYKRKWAKISYAFFHEATGLSKRSARRGTDWLIFHKIAMREKAQGKITSYSFNKYFNTWLPVRKKAPGAQKSARSMREKAQGTLREKAHPHLLKTKETFKEKRPPPKRGFGEPPNYKKYKSSDQTLEGKADITTLVLAEEILRKCGEKRFSRFCQVNNICSEDIIMIRQRA